MLATQNQAKDDAQALHYWELHDENDKKPFATGKKWLSIVIFFLIGMAVWHVMGPQQLSHTSELAVGRGGRDIVEEDTCSANNCQGGWQGGCWVERHDGTGFCDTFVWKQICLHYVTSQIAHHLPANRLAAKSTWCPAPLTCVDTFGETKMTVHQARKACARLKTVWGVVCPGNSWMEQNCAESCGKCGIQLMEEEWVGSASEEVDCEVCAVEFKQNGGCVMFEDEDDMAKRQLAANSEEDKDEGIDEFGPEMFQMFMTNPNCYRTDECIVDIDELCYGVVNSMVPGNNAVDNGMAVEVKTASPLTCEDTYGETRMTVDQARRVCTRFKDNCPGNIWMEQNCAYTCGKCVGSCSSPIAMLKLKE